MPLFPTEFPIMHSLWQFLIEVFNQIIITITKCPVKIRESNQTKLHQVTNFHVTVVYASKQVHLLSFPGKLLPSVQQIYLSSRNTERV